MSKFRWTSENTSQLCASLLPFWVLSFIITFSRGRKKRTKITDDAISNLVPGGDENRIFTEKLVISFWVYFVIAGILIMIAATARCFSLEKLMKKLHMKFFVLRILNILFVVSAAFIMAMSFTPDTPAHDVSVAIGLTIMMISQFMDAIIWSYIQNKGCSIDPNNYCGEIGYIFLLLFASITMVGLIAAATGYPTITQWIGVLSIFISFFVYGIQAFYIKKVLNKS